MRQLNWPFSSILKSFYCITIFFVILYNLNKKEMNLIFNEVIERDRTWAEAWASLLSVCKDVSACNSTHLAGVHCWNTEMSLAEQLEEQGFSPSGRRTANVIAQRVAAGVQPGRRAMPTLLPEGLGPEVHLELALQLVHPFELPVPLPEHCTYVFQMQEKHCGCSLIVRGIFS